MSNRLLSRFGTDAAAPDGAVPIAIDKPVAAQHLLVHVPAAANAVELVLGAHRLAARLPARWTAIHIDACGRRPADGPVEPALRLALQLGGDAVVLPGQDIAGEVLAFARANGAEHIVIGGAPGRGWKRWLGFSLAGRLLRAGAPINLHVVAGEPPPKPDSGPGTAPSRFAPLPHLAAVAAVTVAAAIGYPLVHFASVHDVGMVLLMAVIFVARRFGLWPSVTASVLSVAVYDFFFLPPVYSFTLAHPSDILTLLGFLAVALIVSSLTAQTRRQTVHLFERIRTISALYAFSRQAVGIASLDEMLQMAAAQLSAAVDGGPLQLLLPGPAGLVARAASPGSVPLDAAETEAATRCWQNDQPTHAGTDGRALFLPLHSRHGSIGVVALRGEPPLSHAARRLLDALVDQAAIAIERIRLAEDVDEAKLQAETERLRSALLTSVSHDLRTPLAYIIGALSSLRSYGNAIEPAACAELVATAQDEAERLDRHVGNLLDMTRLESGALQVTLAPVAVDDVIGAALARCRTLLAGHVVDVVLPDEPPTVAAGLFLLEQVLFNLLDNAAKYTPAGTTITIAVSVGCGTADIAVGDEGEGLPPSALDTLFDPFVRHAPAGLPGTGLGLAICRGFVTAMGGRITAANRTDRPGAVFTITLNLAA